MDSARTGTVDLYWIPLGAGGHSVRFNGRVFEAIEAARRHRRPRDLYHAALVCRLSSDPQIALRLIDAAESVPTPVWGRDELRAGEMWNSNSVAAWLIARAGLPTSLLRPPLRGRAPGWSAGLEVARRAGWST
jgi:hypothetical protein